VEHALKLNGVAPYTSNTLFHHESDWYATILGLVTNPTPHVDITQRALLRDDKSGETTTPSPSSSSTVGDGDHFDLSDTSATMSEGIDQWQFLIGGLIQYMKNEQLSKMMKPPRNLILSQEYHVSTLTHI
jgi:hypothetical protein